MNLTRRAFGTSVATGLAAVSSAQSAADAPLRIGGRRELFVDHTLVGETRGVEFRLATPVDAGPAIHFDQPWEGPFCAYTTIIKASGLFRMYYRGVPTAGNDRNAAESACYAESRDGKTFSRPKLSLFEVYGARSNNVILANSPPYCHNFSPMLDERPGVPASERYKALAGTQTTGLVAFVSSDGVHWKKLREQPVLPPPKVPSLDSQNISFWSETERKYLLYFRTWKKIGRTSYRWVSRATSDDFVEWAPYEEMNYGDAPPEHLYTNQTCRIFARLTFTSASARFMPGRSLHLRRPNARRPKILQGLLRRRLITSRGGITYAHLHGSVPAAGVGRKLGFRSNYPALNLVQTGPSTMSFCEPELRAADRLSAPLRASSRRHGFIQWLSGWEFIRSL